MDVYSLTKKQRPTQLTRGQVDKSAHNSAMTSGQITTAAAAVHSTTTATSAAAMAQLEQKHSQLPPQYRQALLEQQQRQQQQQQFPSAPPTLQEIESKHSQLPPQYRQAVLEQQQREHQLRCQNGNSTSPPRQQNHSASLHSSPTHGNGTNASRRGPAGMNSQHQRIFSAPLMSSHRADSRQGTESSNSSPGPSRAHWKASFLVFVSVELGYLFPCSFRACCGSEIEFPSDMVLASCFFYVCLKRSVLAAFFFLGSCQNKTNHPCLCCCCFASILFYCSPIAAHISALGPAVDESLDSLTVDITAESKSFFLSILLCLLSFLLSCPSSPPPPLFRHYSNRRERRNKTH